MTASFPAECEDLGFVVSRRQTQQSTVLGAYHVYPFAAAVCSPRTMQESEEVDHEWLMEAILRLFASIRIHLAGP